MVTQGNREGDAVVREQAAGETEVEHVDLDDGDAVKSNAAIAGHPIHPMLIPLPIGFLVAAWLADVLYATRGDPFFARAALWLVGGGALTALVAAVPGLVDYLTIRRARSSRLGMVHALGNSVVILLSIVNLVIRLGGETAESPVLPWGLVLSTIIAGLLAVTGWAGGELSYRELVGVNPKRARPGQVHTEVE
jgi:uncharacterized membrane protein